MKEFDLEKYLEKYKNTNVDFYRFPGNYGDSLIWHGTKVLLINMTTYFDIAVLKPYKIDYALLFREDIQV